MKRLAVLLILGLGSCGQETDRKPAQPPAAAAAAPAPQSTVMGKSAPTKAAMMEVPKDKAHLERLLAMGYSVHDDHLHPPGVKECPFNMGGSVVQ